MVRQISLVPELRNKRQHTIDILNTCLMHTSACSSADCKAPHCVPMKRMLKHAGGCTTKASGGCGICKRFRALVLVHARQCAADNCSVPNCNAIQEQRGAQCAQLQPQPKSAPRCAKNAPSMALADASEIHSLVDEVAPSKKRRTASLPEVEGQKRGDKKERRGGGLNAYNIFKSYTKHRLTNGTSGLEEYVRAHFAGPRTYADKHGISICKHADKGELSNLNDVFQTWKRSQTETWGGRETNVLKVNAFLNAKWGDLSDAEKQPYEDALEALLTRRHKQEEEVVPSKKCGTFYSNEAKVDILRKIQAAKEADPKQTFRKLCKEQNISERNFYKWKKKLRDVELPPLPPPLPSIIPELPPLPPPSPSIIHD
jgi:hypothetical protein